MKNNINDEILKQISLIKYDRNKTLLENKTIIFEAEENVKWCLTAGGRRVRQDLMALGFSEWVNSSLCSMRNDTEARNHAALYYLIKIQKKIGDSGANNNWNSFFKVTLTSLPSGDAQQKFSKFGINMIRDLAKKLKRPTDLMGIDADTEDWSKEEYADNIRRNPYPSDEVIADEINRYKTQFNQVYNTFYFQNFYFDNNKIIQSLDQYGMSPYFENGAWEFYSFLFSDDPGYSSNLPYFTQIVNNVSRLSSNLQYTIPVKVPDQPGEVQNRIWAKEVEKPITLLNVGKDGSIDFNWTGFFHLILPLTSLAVNILVPFPAGAIIGCALELIDAAIYKYYDKDPYMTGFAIVFAFLPFVNLKYIPGFKNLVKAYSTEKAALSAWWKRMGSRTMTKIDSLFAENLLEYAGSSVGKKIIFTNFLKKNLALLFIETIPIQNFIIFMLRLTGSVLWNGFTKMILQIWGATYVYDYWASRAISSCSATFNWDEMLPALGKYIGPDRAVDKIVKEIGNLEKKLKISINAQPFTQSPQQCEMLKKIKELKMYEKILAQDPDAFFEQRVLECFKVLQINDAVISSLYAKRFETEVVFLQIFLKAYGSNANIFSGIDVKFEDADKSVKAWIEKNKTPKGPILKNVIKTITFSNVEFVSKIEIIDSISGKVLDTIRTLNQWLATNKKHSIKSKPINAGVPLKINVFYLGEFGAAGKVVSDIISYDGLSSIGYDFGKTGIASPMLWGYYDDKTMQMVLNYQDMKGITPTGNVDDKTLWEIISDIETKKHTLKNITGLPLTLEAEEAENLVRKYVIDQNDYDEQTITPPSELSDQQKKDTANAVIKVIEFDNTLNVDTLLYYFNADLKK